MKHVQFSLLIVVAVVGSACASKRDSLRHDISDELAANEAAGESGPLSAMPADRSLRLDPAESSSVPPDAAQTPEEEFLATDSLSSEDRGGALSHEPTPASAYAAELSEAEEDAALLYGDSVVPDPWEGYNRRIHRFNAVVDRRLLRPLAVGYAKAVPAPVRSGVSRFFHNLGEPATAINQALQGDPVLALGSLGRFVVNTTLGVGGVFDTASRMGMHAGGSEDFGQTLAVWGWRDSRYLVLPFFGPRTLRDTISIVGDQRTAPLGYVNDSRAAAALQLLQIVDGRTQLMSFDEARQDAYDDYTFVRDAWSQRRNHQIEQDAEVD